MRKFYEKLANVPTLAILSFLAIIPAFLWDGIYLIAFEDYFDMPGNVILSALIIALVICVAMNKKKEVLGLFTIVMGVYLVDCIVTAVGQIQSANETFAIEEYAQFAPIDICFAVCNIAFAIGIILFIVAKFMMKKNKTVVINITLAFFTLSILGVVGAMVASFISGYYTFVIEGYEFFAFLYDIGSLATLLFFVSAASHCESISRE